MVFPLKHHGLPTKENEGYFWLLIKNPLPLFNKNLTTFSDFFKLNSAQAASQDFVSLAGGFFVPEMKIIAKKFGSYENSPYLCGVKIT